MTKLITKEILKKWSACIDGYQGFNRLFPDGADLKTASEGLIADGHPDWSSWLWDKCKKDDDFAEQTVISAGDRGTASAGYLGTASAGYLGTASAGDLGTASAGDRGTASAGDLGTASAGYLGTASAGDRGTASAGDGGAIALMYYDAKKQKYLRKVGAVEDGGDLKPGHWYKLDDTYNFVEVPADEVEALIKEREEERKNA